MAFDDILDTSPDLTPDNVEEYLVAARYPVDRDDLILMAQYNRAPQSIIKVLYDLPEGVYRSVDEVDYYLRKALR